MALKTSRLMLLMLTAGLGACSGAGGGSAHAPAPTGATGTSSLTIRYPAHVGVARTARSATAAPAATRRNGSTGRGAAYVNPNSGNQLIITPPNGQLATTIAVAPTSDGTQSASISLLSNNYYSGDIGVIEQDGSSNLLAQGTNANAFTLAPGGTASLSVTMQMNATRVALTSDAAAGLDAIIGGAKESSAAPLCIYANTTPVLPFPADPSNTFVLPGTGVGSATAGLPSASLGQTVGGTLAAGVLGFRTTFTSANQTMDVAFTVTNPVDGYPYTGWFHLGNHGSAPCAVFASVANGTVPVSGTTTLTVSGGTPPYTVTESDGNCTFVATNPPSNSVWTVTHASSGTCAPMIADANGTAPGSPPTISAQAATIYIADGPNGVTACDENGNNVGLSGFGVTYATAITFDVQNQRFLVYDITASNLKGFTKSGSPTSFGSFALNTGNQLVWNPLNGHFYTAYNQQGGPDVIEWDGSGNTVNESGGFPGNRGVGISFDATNQHLYVVDDDQNVYAFNTDGTSYTTPGGFPTVSSERFVGGDDIQVDAADNRVFVVQKSPSTAMLVYDLQGNPVSASGGFPGLNGNVVYDPFNHRIYSLGQNPMLAWDINGNSVSLPGSCNAGTSGFAAVVVQ